MIGIHVLSPQVSGSVTENDSAPFINNTKLFLVHVHVELQRVPQYSDRTDTFPQFSHYVRVVVCINMCRCMWCRDGWKRECLYTTAQAVPLIPAPTHTATLHHREWWRRRKRRRRRRRRKRNDAVTTQCTRAGRKLSITLLTSTICSSGLYECPMPNGMREWPRSQAPPLMHHNNNVTFECSPKLQGQRSHN